jgi:uncharacterized membrane protein HdeD (DUF308 family)
MVPRLGILLIVLGVIALGSSAMMTMATMVFIGWLMIIGGIMEALTAFSVKPGAAFSSICFPAFCTPSSVHDRGQSGATAVALTLLIAMFLVFSGIFRIVVAVIVRFQNWGWLLLSGAINLLLGISIWQEWPLSGLWVIGLFVGIDMILNGVSLVMLGLKARKLPAVTV